MLSLFVAFKDWILHGPGPIFETSGMDRMAQTTMKLVRERVPVPENPMFPDTLRLHCAKTKFYWSVRILGNQEDVSKEEMLYCTPPRHHDLVQFAGQVFEVAGYQELGWILWVYPPPVMKVRWD